MIEESSDPATPEAHEQAAAETASSHHSNDEKLLSSRRDLEILEAILKELPQDSLHQLTRVTREGLFVEEGLKLAVIEAYRRFICDEAKSHSEISDKKLIRRLFGAELPELHYLLDGKVCIPGYLVPLSIDEGKRYPVPFFRGSTISALDYLHLRDPILKDIDGLESFVDNRGFRLSVVTRSASYAFDTAFLAEYSRVLRDDRKLIARYPAAGISLRACLPALVESVRRARFVGSKQSLLIPAKYRNNKAVKLLQIGQTYFVVGREGKLFGCYGLQGRNLHKFLISEFDALKGSVKGGGLKGFSFERKNRRILGHVRVDENRLSVEPGAFKEFVIEAPRARHCSKKLSRMYTLRDCLMEFIKVLQGAKRVERRDLPGFLLQDVKEDTRFYLSDDFLFLFSPRGVVFSCATRYPRKDRGSRGVTGRKATGKSGSSSRSGRRGGRGRGRGQGNKHKAGEKKRTSKPVSQGSTAS